MNKIHWIVVLSLIFSIGCRDIIEPDISNKKIQILSPPDSLHSTTASQIFWWNEVEGAEAYNIQIVTPSFSMVQQLILDSTISSNQFFMSLIPGTYQWRIRAQNNGYSTSYLVSTLFIDSTSSLNNQVVVLVSPQDNYSTNDTNISFQWNSIYNAEEYRFKLEDLSGNILLDTFQVNTFLSHNMNEGNYTWKVRAENNSGSTAYTSRSINIDFTAPSAPNGLVPLDRDTVPTTNVSMSWNSDPTAIGDSLFIYNDSLLTSLNYSSFTATPSYLFTGLSLHHYFWRVKSRDQAGNWGLFTSLYSFFIP